jgi:hypothetical protein
VGLARNKVVWIPESKMPNGVAEVPRTDLIRRRSKLRGPQRCAWAKVPYFRIYDLRSTYETRLSAGGVADEWVTQLLRQGDAKAFKKCSQMKLQMKREALQKLNRTANEGGVLRHVG